MHLDLSWLQALIVTADCGSFQSAALKAGLGRATLRNRVEALERQVGLSLLVRTVRGVELTSAGAAFLPRARALVADSTALARFAQSHTDEVSGDVHICAPVGMPAQLHALALGRIRQLHPGLRIRLVLLEDPTTSGPEADFVLHFCPRVTRGDFRTVRLARVPLRLVASPAYVAQRGLPRSVDELNAHSLLVWTAPGDDGSRLPLQSGGWVPANPAVRSADIATLRSLAESGEGIAFVPHVEALAPVLGDEPLTEVLPEIVGREISLWILMPTPTAGSLRTRAIVQISQDLHKVLTAAD